MSSVLEAEVLPLYEVHVNLAQSEGFEPPTLGFVDRCSNPLSYDCMNINTSMNPLVIELNHDIDIDGLIRHLSVLKNLKPSHDTGPEYPGTFVERSTDQVLLEQLQEDLKLKHDIKHILYYRFPYLGTVRPHLDAHGTSWKPAPWSLLIPLKNCDNVAVGWHHLKDPNYEVICPEDKIPVVEFQHLTRVHKYYLTKPCIIRTDLYHSAINEAPIDAYAMTARIDPKLDLSDLSEIFY